MIDREPEDRRVALEHAMSRSRDLMNGDDPEVIVRNAQVFFDFLRGASRES